jgi:predicted lipid carrier protein YhbT
MRASLRWLPEPALRLVLRRVAAGLPRNHSDLMRRLSKIGPGRLLFEPSDLSRRFLLNLGADALTIDIVAPGTTAEVTMRGPLATLIGLLEGRTDSDTALFARDIIVIGDMNLAVAFRNVLDGETVNLVDDALAQFGPLSRPLGWAAVQVHRRVDLAGRRLTGMRDLIHRAAHGGRDPDEEQARQRTKLDDLLQRVGQLERRARRTSGAA